MKTREFVEGLLSCSCCTSYDERRCSDHPASPTSAWCRRCGEVCRECLASCAAREHGPQIRMRRMMWQSAIRVEDVVSLLDGDDDGTGTSPSPPDEEPAGQAHVGVQVYLCNQWPAVYISCKVGTRRRSDQSGGDCEGCGTRVKSAFRFCSLECKLRSWDQAPARPPPLPRQTQRKAVHPHRSSIF